MSEDRRQLVWFAILMLLAFGTVSSYNILYTNRVNRESDQLWCDLMVSLDDRQRTIRTTDPEAIRFRNQVRALREGLHCPPSTPGPVRSSP